jgi:beta-glucosidase
MAVPAIRANVPDASIGIVLDLNVVTPASQASADAAAARRFDGAQNRWFLDALFKSSYPEDILSLSAGLLPPVEAEDNRIIAADIDFLGVNIYRRSIMAAGHELPPLNFKRVNPPGSYSAVGYEIWPECVYDVLQYVHKNYGPRQIYITENGLALADEEVTARGEVHDLARAKYLVDHLEQVARAAGDGVPVRGYFVWTLTDNFEWTYGYTTPFGIVHVDFASQERRIKDSGRVFALIAAAGLT